MSKTTEPATKSFAIGLIVSLMTFGASMSYAISDAKKSESDDGAEQVAISESSSALTKGDGIVSAILLCGALSAFCGLPAMAVADKIEAKKKAKNVALQQLKQNQH